MPIRKDNYETMSKASTVLKPMAETRSIKIRFNLELLKGCEFHCAGCHVNRNNHYSDHDLDIIKDAGFKFLKNDYEFNEVILGPTDFFSAFNSVDLIRNKKFVDIFMNPNIFMTIITTLQTTPEEIERRIAIVNENFLSSTCIEVLIIFELEKVLNEDQAYFQSLRDKIELLQQFNGEVEYAFQINIQDTGRLSNFNLARLSKIVEREFSTIVEFNPSFLRSYDQKRGALILEKWNEMLRANIESCEDKQDLLLTMRNKNHGGFSEITYNFKEGQFSVCPFIYENVYDKGKKFKIGRANNSDYYELSDFINHRLQADINQYRYSELTEECNQCNYLSSCIGKQVLLYMESNDIKSCMLAKEAMSIY